jgi:hypothetical protein
MKHIQAYHPTVYIFYILSATKSRISTVWRMTSLPVLMSRSLGITTSITLSLRCVFIRETKSHYLTWKSLERKRIHKLSRRKGVCFIARHFRFQALGRKSFADLFNHDFGWELLMFLYRKFLYKVVFLVIHLQRWDMTPSVQPNS